MPESIGGPQKIGKKRLLKAAVLMSQVYEGKDLHKLSMKEHELIRLLEEVGLILPNLPANGFVGKFSPAVAELVAELLG